ncbi:MAG: hypothetical protein LAT55_04810 [Opitutales bacterium]|nr:hypothetical protein [Opitutales bacterium]
MAVGFFLAGCGEPEVAEVAPVENEVPEEGGESDGSTETPEEEPEVSQDLVSAPEVTREVPEGDFAEKLDHLDELYQEGEFFEAWQLAREWSREYTGGAEAEALSDRLRVFTQARREVSELSFAIENLGSDDPMVKDVARREIRNAGEVGIILLRRSIGNATLDQIPEIFALLENAGDERRVAAIFRRMQSDDTKEIRLALAEGLRRALQENLPGAYEAVVAEIGDLPPEEVTPVWPALVQEWRAEGRGESSVKRMIELSLVRAAQRLPEERETERTEVFQAAVILRDQEVLNRVMDLLGSDDLNIQGLPPGWKNVDIGEVGEPGSAVFEGGRFVVHGAGDDIWGGDDEFHFVWREVSGDTTMEVLVHAQENTATYAKSGLMIRQSLDQNAPHGMVVVSPEGRRIAFQYRKEAGGDMSSDSSDDYEFPVWLRLRVEDGLVSAARSYDREEWEELGEAEIPLGDTFYFGLVVCSNVRGTLNRTEFEIPLEDLL